MTKKERDVLLPTTLGSAILFVIGLLFAYFFLVPAALKFFIMYGSDIVEPFWSFDQYFNEFFGAYGDQPFNWVFSADELKWGGIQDAPRLALKQLKDWYDNGYIHPDFTIDNYTREGLQKFFAGIVGYLGNWASYNEMHIDFVRNRTMADLQRKRDIELL